MRSLPVVVLMLLFPVAWAAAPGRAPPLTGKVLETMDAGPYTYLRLQAAQGETWAAVPKAAVHKGQQVTIQGPMTMTQFESRTLNRTFDTIVFGTLAGAGPAASEQEILAAHSGAAKGGEVEVGQVKKATGPDARTVAEVVAQRAKLTGKPVAVRGKVVKFSAGIMDRNWLHLRDGSGSATDKTNDLLVTTKQTAAVGDVVLVRGVVRTNQDFGAGYAYEVLVENATLGK
jgi:hypothetical protein